jgi:hypothetical protein
MLVTGKASAADAPIRIERMADELRNNEDFRVRTQAALALGASKDKRAVPVLCDGLDDNSTTVRAAAAAALGKLLLGGLDCMKTHLASESAASVKSVVTKSIDALKAGQKPVTPITVETKYYVAIGPTTDKTGRTGTDVDDMVHGAAEETASGIDGVVVAPRGETTTEGKAVMAKWKKLKAFFLWPKVQPPVYSGGNLTVRFEVTVFTYPGKAMMGVIPLSITAKDVPSLDRDTENELIRRAASKALAQFADNADRFSQ